MNKLRLLLFVIPLLGGCTLNRDVRVMTSESYLRGFNAGTEMGKVMAEEGFLLEKMQQDHEVIMNHLGIIDAE